MGTKWSPLVSIMGKKILKQASKLCTLRQELNIEEHTNKELFLVRYNTLWERFQ